MHDSVPAVVLAVAVVIAGCNGLAPGGDETPTSTLTPAAVPTDEPTSTPVPRLAPGLTSRGVADPFALGEAHVATLDGISYSMQENLSVTYRNGTSYRRLGSTAQLAANDSRYYVSHNSFAETYSEGPVTNSFWSNGSQIIRAQTINGSTAYSVPRGADRERRSPEQLGYSPTNREQIYTLFGSVETRVTDREQRDGTAVYRVEATDVTNPATFESAKWQTPENLTLVADVDSRGLVSEYRVHYTATLGGSPVDVNRRVRYTDLGNTTVERPPWYDEAIENVSTAIPAD